MDAAEEILGILDDETNTNINYDMSILERVQANKWNIALLKLDIADVEDCNER